jgi:molecular chaperone GrpE
MSESTVQVQDKRRFNPDGTPREVEESVETASSAAPTEAASEASGGNAAAEVAQLRSDLEVARRRVDELARGIQEVMREREEFKQRLIRERERLLDVEKGQVALALIEAVDELDLSLRADDRSALAEGVRLIRDKLLQRLQGFGIERLELVGRPYDPNLAEAVDLELVPTPAQSDRVLAELRPAYALKGRVIRPGRVKVGRYLEPAKA